MDAATDRQLTYDPYDIEIDVDPYPTYRRLRDEAPVYYDEKFDFWGLSRFDDVETGLRDTANLSNAKGDILEVVKAEPNMPEGVFINEDPPLHTVHRLLVSRAFTPKKMRAIEEQVRAFCAACLDPLVGGDRFNFTLDLGAEMPMRVIGMLVGMPDSLQRSVRSIAHRRLRNEPGKPLKVSKDNYFNGNMFAEYVDWRAKNPSDDLVTELLNIEFEDVSGTVRRLNSEELLVFLGVIANAGTETVGRLFGWLGKLLGEHPDQRRELVADPSLIGGAVEEVLRFEPPVHNIARYVSNDIEYHGQTIPAGSALLLMAGAANRDERKFDDPDRFDIHRNANHLSFGRGTHFCLGASLARLEGRVALEEILKRWPDWTVDLDNAVRAPTATVRGWDSMPVVVG
ncbi:cytochrome P450 monooxygenase [Mycolicibacterium chitae]|uniref:Steroid C26-monooxygenase n=1 Tax=Mycolicibacterium chitae TaxID=1792 RepID=A0A3S4V9V0_MYCCI|nr:cytochrome P450 [Mycolicibacterium chitae]MCV7107302.1 cytochrome P450 [Mycolicibacterium chitae]BBZ03438.1 cytochrome P450 monooxygenase [Mycolicibacterium chitae]VEG46979.1 cytochrome P450 [Mycolicibacterium chitae]